MSGDRPDWHETSADLLYRASPDLFISGSVVERQRATTDILYAARASYFLHLAYVQHLFLLLFFLLKLMDLVLGNSWLHFSYFY